MLRQGQVERRHVRGVRPGPGGRPRSDEGAFLVVWAVAIVSILVFAALAIDLGNIAQTKQHAQNSADSAALSAVGDLAPLTNTANGVTSLTAEANAVTDVEAYVQKNDPSVANPADWTDPTKCPKGILPSTVAPSVGPNATNCIGFFNPGDSSKSLTAPTGIAVVVPSRTANYTLGKVGGLSNQKVSAVAEASVQNPGSGFLLPFGFDGGGAGLQCLKTGSGNKAAGCTGFAIGSGNFGVLNSPRYRVLPASASGGGNDPVLLADIALGVDHPLNVYVSGNDICDATKTPPNCTQYNKVAPFDNGNYVAPQPGQTLNDPGPGIFSASPNTFQVSGCTITVPRLGHPDGFVASGSCAQANTFGPSAPYLATDTFGSTSPNLNGSHISKYLVSGSVSPIWTACYAGKGPAGYTPNAATDPIDRQIAGVNVWAGSATTEDGCLSTLMQSKADATPIFTSALATSPRFGVVPVVGSICSGRSACPITGFDGVFLSSASGKGNKVDAITAWVFPLNWIQPGQVNGGGNGTFNGGAYVANLCSLPAGNC